MRPLHQLSAIAALAGMSAGAVSAAEIAASALEHTASREGAIQAWAYCDPENVLRQAQKPRGGGALAGLLVGIKDNFDTADMPTSYGSRFYEGHRPASDAAAVALLREQGAIIFGKTVCTEFAGWPASRTRNPRSHAHTPGGSSSGSAAAVADRMVPVALGTQTLGSVIGQRPIAAPSASNRVTGGSVASASSRWQKVSIPSVCSHATCAMPSFSTGS